MPERPPPLTTHVHWCASPTGWWSGHTWTCMQAECAAALDIETLRLYHDRSFMDPPSYHEPAPEDGDLWNCPQCVERHIENAYAALSALARAVGGQG